MDPPPPPPPPQQPPNPEPFVMVCKRPRQGVPLLLYPSGKPILPPGATLQGYLDHLPVIRKSAPHLMAAYSNGLRQLFGRRRRWFPSEEGFGRVWKWLGEVEMGDGMEGWETGGGVEDGDEEGRGRKRVMLTGSQPKWAEKSGEEAEGS